MAVPRTTREIRDAIAAGALTAVEACRASLDRIALADPSVGAFRTVIGQRALERASAVDNARKPSKDSAPLAGVAVAIKDNICTRGVPTTASSRILEHYAPPYDATVITRLEAAGAIVVGKTNCDEFAMGSSTENSAFGVTRNPWRLDRTPGGSSGGSAAAVAAGMTSFALGSDTGGSVRQPASFCGVVGLKPTYGRVSRYGLLAFASSLDQIGPLTRTAWDAALVLTVMAGRDERDATSADVSVPDYTRALSGDIRGLRVGVPRQSFEEGVEEHVTRAVTGALDVLKHRGATLVDILLPHAKYAIPVYYLVAPAEASSNLARYDGVRYGFRAALPRDGTLRAMYSETRDQGFGPEVKRRIMLGTYVLSAGYYDAYYLKAQKVRTLIRQDYDRAFAGIDVIAMPTSPTTAFRLGERVQDPLQMYLADVFTVSANLTGLPAISFPCGLTPDRLPVGLQLVGKGFDEATILKVADAYERDTEWWKEEPEL
jgi:aspartyl-tRNA(Asn)/glutamyl-tRNA(Gln) amidotransferase subunit A